MIRHSSSFFISLVFHILLALALFYAYKTISKVEKKAQSSEKRVKIALCNIQKNQPAPKQEVSSKPNIKKVVPLVKKQVLKKKKIIEKKIKVTPKKTKIQKPLPKPIKKIKAKKTEVKKEQIKEVLTTKVQKAPLPIPTKEEAPVITTPIETKHEKSVRLENDYINKNIQKITQLLRDNLYYPRSARKRGITGKIIVKFKLSTSGKAHSIEVIESKSEVLSRAAIRTIENIEEEFPVPPEELVLHVPINYTLRR